jgi:large subunit ribosomal protein L4
MKVPVYNQQGEEVKKIDLPKGVFDVKVNQDLIHQVMVSQAANRRQATVHTKDRSEVSGGGKKPWRQKGTGRARHGSIRSPLWKGGGVTFGPRKEKNYDQTIPQAMRRKALFMVLSGKLVNNEIVFIDKINLGNTKTKEMKQVISKLPINEKSVLFLLPQAEKKTILSSRNIPRVGTMLAQNINAFDLLSVSNLVIPEQSIEIITKTFLPSGAKK